MQPLKVLIVDDEPPAIERMITLFGGLPDYQIIGCESRSARVLERCKQLAPDAVLLDIEMPGMDGIELAGQIQSLQPAPAVIFVTAFEDYAVDAFGLAALDYLVKPIRLARLKQALNRIQPSESDADEHYVSARIGERLLRIPLRSIRAFVAGEKAVIVHSVDGLSMMDGSLKQIEQIVGERFMRVHRNALVSRMHIRSVYRGQDGIDQLEVEGIELRPEVSRRNRGELKKWLKKP